MFIRIFVYFHISLSNFDIISNSTSPPGPSSHKFDCILFHKHDLTPDVPSTGMSASGAPTQSDEDPMYRIISMDADNDDDDLKFQPTQSIDLSPSAAAALVGGGGGGGIGALGGQLLPLLLELTRCIDR